MQQCGSSHGGGRDRVCRAARFAFSLSPVAPPTHRTRTCENGRSRSRSCSAFRHPSIRPGRSAVAADRAVHLDRSAVVADDLVVAPDDPAVVPDDPAVAPDYSAVVPDDPAVAPDYSAVAPDYSAVVPDDPAVAPDYSAVHPDCPAVYPGRSAVAQSRSAMLPDPSAASAVPLSTNARLARNNKTVTRTCDRRACSNVTATRRSPPRYSGNRSERDAGSPRAASILTGPAPQTLTSSSPPISPRFLKN